MDPTARGFEKAEFAMCFKPHAKPVGGDLRGIGGPVATLDAGLEVLARGKTGDRLHLFVSRAGALQLTVAGLFIWPACTRHSWWLCGGELLVEALRGTAAAAMEFANEFRDGGIGGTTDVRSDDLIDLVIWKGDRLSDLHGDRK